DAFATPGKFRIDRKTKKPIMKNGTKVRGKTGGRYEMIKKMKAWQPQLIVLDESHRIKTPSARKSTAMHTLGKVADYRVILTGTVVTKSKKLYDIYSQWQFLTPDRFPDMNFAEFKSMYSRWEPREKYSVWKGNRNEEHLHKKIHLDSFSITREECYDLPKETQQIIPVPLEESAQLYDEMPEDMAARLDTGEVT